MSQFNWWVAPFVFLTPLFGAAQSAELDADHWNLDLAGRTAAIWLRTEIA